MSLLNDASLILVPSAIKTGEVLVQKPLPNKFADETGNYDGNDPQTNANLTFTRASSATRVASNGLIEKVRTNVLLQSNSFDTTWTNSSTSETSGQSGYDGTNNAWLIDKSAASGKISQTISTSALVTFSLYAKANTLNWIAILYEGVSGGQAYFNLQNGVVGSRGTGVLNHTITAVGSGWYRITTTTSSASSVISIFPADANNNVSGTSGNIYIQDAQLETGDIATDYIVTTTAAVSVGPVANVPRLDYSGGATCPRLNLEPQRTNAITFSEQMDNAAWIKNVNAAVTANQAISPDGYQNADLVSNTLVGGGMDYYQLLTGSASTTYTYSVFVKAATHTKCALRAVIGAPSPFTTTPAAYFDLATASVIQSYGSATNAKIEAVGSNGWYRVSMTFPTIGTSHYLNLFPLSDTYSTSASNAPLNYSSTGGVYFWGAQYEIGAYPTSYINTLNSAVTRLADSASKTGISSLIGSATGTAFIDIQETNNIGGTTNADILLLSNNSNSALGTYVLFLHASTGNLRIYFLPENISVTVKGGDNRGQRLKIAFAYSSGDFVCYVNGAQVYSASRTLGTGLDKLTLNSSPNSGFEPVNQCLLFKTRLSNAQLAELTTL